MGYFEFIARCDRFILLDDVQYTRRDWRNRNKIRTRYGDRWLTIPVKQSGNYEAKINEMVVADPLWMRWHFDTLAQAYGQCSGWKRYSEELEWCYIDSPEKLSGINRAFLDLGCKWLGVTTPISWSTDYASHGFKSEKLVSLCKSCGADTYLTGPAAKGYLDESYFNANGITVEWMAYHDWPRLSFLHSLFTTDQSALSILPREARRDPAGRGLEGSRGTA